MTVKVDTMLSIRGIRIRFPARSWELAHDAIEALKDEPPEGYTMVESQVKPRGIRKGGRRCNVRLTFVQNDDRVPMIATSGAKAFFEPYAQEAQGVEE